MMTKLPRWIEFGAFLLAGVAGSVNAIGLLGFKHQSVSHLSGTATLIGTEMLSSSLAEISHLLGVLFSFLLGAALSGVVLSGNSLTLGKRYDALLWVEASLLFLSMYLLNQGYLTGHYAASAACGLQNALATSYSGAIVRTTHVTGLFTDLGIMLGARLRGKPLDKRKAILFLLIIVGFILGGFVGALLFQSITFFALAAPASVCIVLALAYRWVVPKDLSS